MKKELKFEDMSMTDFIRMAKKNGYEVQIIEDVDRIKQLKKENQKAIECLREVKEHIKEKLEWCWENSDLNYWDRNTFDGIYEYIDNKIKELEEEK